MKKDSYTSMAWFFAGFTLFVFTRTVTFIPWAIIIAPIFILRFIRMQKLVKGILLTLYHVFDDFIMGSLLF